MTESGIAGKSRRVKLIVAGVLSAAVLVGGGGILLMDPDRGCSGEAYDDFKAHLDSRGATATCEDFKATAAAGIAAEESGSEYAESEEYYESLPEEGFEEEGSYEAPGTTAVEMVRVPNLIGLDPNTAYDVAEEWGLRLSNGRIGSWGVVASQTGVSDRLCKCVTSTLDR